MVLRRRVRRPPLTLEPHPDDLPKRGLFAEPVRLTRLDGLDIEVVDDGQLRATFLAEVKDADGKRCSDLAVQARVSGPERASTVQATTDLFGRVRFRMTGPTGSYRIEILDVAAGGLDWDRDGGPRTAAVHARRPGSDR